MEELMEEYNQNINDPLVVIPTAGLGSRLGYLTHSFNKSLLPFQNKPILSHIIENFPKNSSFLIILGFQAEQVKDFCKLAYPELHFTFIIVDDYESNKAGPGYSLLYARQYINRSFWYVPCDTIFKHKFKSYEPNEDTFFVAVNDNHIDYTTFEIIDSRITSIKFKENSPENYLVFTGLSFIKNYKEFLNNIHEAGGLEMISGISIGSKADTLDSWSDMGNINLYKKLQTGFDFSKTEEYTYRVGNKVLKWNKDKNITLKKYKRWRFNSSIVPKNCLHFNNWLTYDYFPGNVLYDKHDILTLENLLTWLKEKVWIKKEINLYEASKNFYFQKTKLRLESFFTKYPNLPNISKINNLDVRPYDYYFSKIDWNILFSENVSAFIHGDLQFDNIIIDSNKNFCMIDWRTDFGGEIAAGDIHYDLAKLLCGFIIDYTRIKNNDFKISFDTNHVFLEIPNILNNKEYTNIVERFIHDEGYCFKKVQTLVPLIFWNMSPLHSAPFDLFLFYLGIKLFAELENEVL